MEMFAFVADARVYQSGFFRLVNRQADGTQSRRDLALKLPGYSCDYQTNIETQNNTCITRAGILFGVKKLKSRKNGLVLENLVYNGFLNNITLNYPCHYSEMIIKSYSK